MFGRDAQEGAHAVLDLAGQAVHRVADPKPEIGRHLVVAAAPGMQALAGLADAFGQARLDVEVDVLQARVEDKFPGLDLLANLLQPGADGGLVLWPDDPHMSQHGGVG